MRAIWKEKSAFDQGPVAVGRCQGSSTHQGLHNYGTLASAGIETSGYPTIKADVGPVVMLFFLLEKGGATEHGDKRAEVDGQLDYPICGTGGVM